MELAIRKLEAGDFQKGFLGLLAQLTSVGDISQSEFEARFKEIDGSPDYHIAVAEDKASGKLLGAATLLIERKFIHNCGKVGHIEDVVVDSAARGQRLGLRLVSALMDVCQGAGCYKVILDCAEHNVAFYEKAGLKTKELQMVRYFDR